MSFKHLIATLCIVSGLAACGPTGESWDEETSQKESLLTVAQERARSDVIKSAAAARGITNGVIIAGVAYHESGGLAQCLNENPIHCPGPASADCGGGAVLAGSGDGICSNEQGGIGMFQLDRGTYTDTVSYYGPDVLTVAGNSRIGVGFIINMVKTCPFPSSLGFTNDADAVAWLNSATKGTARYDEYLTKLASCYNGCVPGCSAHFQRRLDYDNGITYLLNTFGSDYWNSNNNLLVNVPAQRGVYHKDGRQEVFARGTDNTIWHSYQTAPNAGWVAWSSFGGNTFKGEPVAHVDAAGRLNLFAVAADGTVWRKSWAPGGNWTAWLSHGGTGAVGQVVVAENTSGILEVFVRRGDNTVWRIKQSAAGSSTWSAWASMGGSLASEPIVGRNADGRLEVFAQGRDNSLYHAWQSTAGGTWSAFYSMPATLTSAPAIARNADGRLEVFGRGTDGRLFKIFQQSLNGNWSTWFAVSSNTVSSGATVGYNPDGRAEVFVRGTDGQVWHAWQQAANGAWSAFYGMGGNLSSAPAVGRNMDGRLEVFGRDVSGKMFHMYQVSGGWSGWYAMDGTISVPAF